MESTRKLQELVNKFSKVVGYKINKKIVDFPGGAAVKNPPANAGNTGSSPGPGRFHMPQSN